MRTTVKRALLLVVVAAVLVFAASGFACVRELEDPISVRDHFDVVVQDRGQPAIGLEVVVQVFDSASETWKTVANATTDTAGRAAFAGIPVGSYFVGTHTRAKDDGHPIRVTDDAHTTAQPRIELTWPPRRVITTNKFEGVLTSYPSDEVPSEPLHDVTIKVLEARSGRVVSTTLTDYEGRFSVEGVSPGMYFLELSGEGREREDARVLGWKLEGYLAMEYNPLRRDAPSSAHLLIMMTDCGLMYKVAK